MSTPFSISADFIAEHNAPLQDATTEDYDALKRALGRRGIDADALLQKVMAFGVAIPTWGVGTGGTRFARFPGPGEPRNVVEKIDDCAVIQQMARATPTISPHIPWDKVDDYAALREQAASHGLSFDAVNSNTFQDQPGQEFSYKFGSLSHHRCACSRAGHRPQCRMHRDRPQARLEGVDGLDRRRRELCRSIESDQGARPLYRRDA
ncbi:L-rhamnose isomerase [Bradyrhizobium sp. USDA 4472]